MYDKDKRIALLESQLKKEFSFNSAVEQEVSKLCIEITELLKHVKEDEKTSAALKGVRTELEKLTETVSQHRRGE